MILTKYNQVKSNTAKKIKVKPKKKRVKTPIPMGQYKCAGCGATKYLQIHHCYYSRGLRDISSIHHCTSWLCYICHQSSTGIHGTHSDGKLDQRLKKWHQTRLMNSGMSLEEFIKIFGRSYR